MNPRQRRGALLLALAAIGALATVFSVASYVSSIETKVGDLQTVVRLTTDVDQLATVSPDQVEVLEVPARWAPERALRSPDELSGLVAATTLPAGTILQEGSVTAPPQIATGEREVAILVSAETGVGGKIQSGDVVDVYGTFGGEGDADPPVARLLLQNLTIVDIAPAVDVDAPESGFGTATAVPVTFAVTTEEALTLAYAESFANEVRLGLRTPVDTAEIPETARTYTESGGQ